MEKKPLKSENQKVKSSTLNTTTNGKIVTTRSEQQLQVQCYTWFHNSFPELRGLLNCNNNNSENVIKGLQNKALGVQNGRSDMVLYYQGRSTHIELKNGSNKQTPNQKKWQELMESQGFDYHVVTNFQAFTELILKIIKK